MVLLKNTFRGPDEPDHFTAFLPAAHQIGYQFESSGPPPPSSPQLERQLAERCSHGTLLVFSSNRLSRSQPPCRFRAESKSLPIATLPDDDHWNVKCRRLRDVLPAYSESHTREPRKYPLPPLPLFHEPSS